MSMEDFVGRSKSKQIRSDQEKAAKTTEQAIKDSILENEYNEAQRAAVKQYDDMALEVYKTLRQTQVELSLQGILNHANAYRDYRGREVNLNKSLFLISKRTKHGQVVQEAKLVIEAPEQVGDDAAKHSVIRSNFTPVWTAHLFWGVMEWRSYNQGSKGGGGQSFSSDIVEPEGFYVRVFPSSVYIAYKLGYSNSSERYWAYTNMPLARGDMHGVQIDDISDITLIKQTISDAYTGILETPTH